MATGFALLATLFCAYHVFIDEGGKISAKEATIPLSAFLFIAIATGLVAVVAHMGRPSTPGRTIAAIVLLPVLGISAFGFTQILFHDGVSRHEAPFAVFSVILLAVFVVELWLARGRGPAVATGRASSSAQTRHSVGP
jgi:drug/metabolite transporter (DMT)-like permease